MKFRFAIFLAAAAVCAAQIPLHMLDWCTVTMSESYAHPILWTSMIY
jgi:hypothetical protein